MEEHKEINTLSYLYEKIKKVILLNVDDDEELALILSTCCFDFGPDITEQAVEAGLSSFAREYLRTHSKIDAYSNFKKAIPGICTNLREKESFPARAYVTMLVNWKAKEFNSTKDEAKDKLMELVKSLEEKDVPQQKIIDLLSTKIEPLIKRQNVWKNVSAAAQRIIGKNHDESLGE